MNHIPLKEVAPLSKVAFQNWQCHRAQRMGAALAYYIALSLAPTVLTLLAIASLAFGTQAAEAKIVSQIQALVGYEGANAVQTMIEGARQPSEGLTAAVLGLAVEFFAASEVVYELRNTLNTIWRVREDTAMSTTQSIFRLVRDRLLSTAIVIALGLFLLLSLIVNAWCFSAVAYLDWGAAPPTAFVQAADSIVSFVVITVLFAFIFRVFPRVRVTWSDVALGALAASLLFSAGKFLLELYLARADLRDVYGAAGSLVAVLLWVYFSAEALLLGAEFTRAYALHFGSMRVPRND